MLLRCLNGTGEELWCVGRGSGGRGSGEDVVNKGCMERWRGGGGVLGLNKQLFGIRESEG